jgi:hypothetical protein
MYGAVEKSSAAGADFLRIFFREVIHWNRCGSGGGTRALEVMGVDPLEKTGGAAWKTPTTT